MDNFDLRKYLAEGCLLKEAVEIDLQTILSGDINTSKPSGHNAMGDFKKDMKVAMTSVEKNNWKDVSGVVTGMENDMIQFKTPKGKEMQASPEDLFIITGWE